MTRLRRRAKRSCECAALAWLSLGGFGGAPGCGRPAPAAEARSPTEAGLEPSVPMTTRAPTRCRLDDTSTGAPVQGLGERLEIGNAVAYAGGYAFGFASDSPSGRQASIAVARSDGVLQRTDLGDLCADCPPPIVAVASGKLWIAAYGVQLGAKDVVRDRLALYSLEAPSRLARVYMASVAVTAGSPPSFDLDALPSGAAMAWEEATGPGHGTIRAAIVQGDRSQASPFDASPRESDADSPRVITVGSEVRVLWIAHAPDTVAAPDAAQVEVPGTARTFDWVQSISLDERGVSTDVVHDLTARTGHVSGFDAGKVNLGTRPTPTSPPAVLVVARDDGRGSDGSEGVIVRVLMKGGVIEPPVPLPTENLGRGGPSLVVGSRGWVFWSNPSDELNLLPLDEKGVPAGAPSLEAEMAEARPLVALPASGKGSSRVVVTAPPQGAVPLRIYLCAMDPSP